MNDHKQTNLDRERKLMEMEHKLDAKIKQLEASYLVSSAMGFSPLDADYETQFKKREDKNEDVKKLQELRDAFKTYQLEGITTKNKDKLLQLCDSEDYKEDETKKLAQEVKQFIVKNETHPRPNTTLKNIEETIIPSDRKELSNEMLREVQSKIREEKEKIRGLKKQFDKLDYSREGNLAHFELRLNRLLEAEAYIKSYQINKDGNYNEQKLLNDLGPIRTALQADKGRTTKNFSVQEKSLLGKFKNKVTERFKPNSVQVIDHIKNMLEAKQMADIRKADKQRKFHPRGT